MEKASELLIIILSSVLVVFLLTLIVCIVKVIQVVKALKRITDTAERLAGSAEAVGDFFERATGPMAFGKFFYNISQHVIDHKKKNKRG
jgi:hypothetical protein